MVQWWAHQDSNLEPKDYESSALTIELWARGCDLNKETDALRGSRCIEKQIPRLWLGMTCGGAGDDIVCACRDWMAMTLSKRRTRLAADSSA
jgi:hypothetical protein